MNWARLARGRWRLAWNTLVRRRGRSPESRAGRPLLGGALAFLLGALVWVGLAGLFGQLAAESATAAEAGGALALVLTATLFGMLVFDLQEAVSTLVADSDLELLRRAPIPSRALFALKLADALPRTSLLLIVIAIPAVVAYHVFYPLPLWAWVGLPLQLAGLWAVPLGIGMALAIRLLARIPARRAREALGLLSTVTLFSLWLANSFLLPRIVEPGGDPLGRLRGAFVPPPIVSSLSPGGWLARSLAAAADGAWSESLGATLALVVAGGLSLALAAAVASRDLESAQSAIAGGPGQARRTRARRIEAARRARGRERRPANDAAPRARWRTLVGAVLVRDARLFLRDWTVLGDVLTTAVLWTLLPLVGAPLYHAAPRMLGRAMLLALTVGLGYEVGARAIPFERRAAAWMRLAPVPPSRWLAAKLAGAALISSPLLALAAVSMTLAFGLSARELFETLAIVAPALGLALAVGLWTGAVFGDPGWTNPRAALTLTGRAVATLLLLVQAVVWLGLSVLAEVGRDSLPPGFLAWGPAVLATSIAMLPLGAAARSLAAREWST